MPTVSPFKGFTPAGVQFLFALKQNNNKTWFDEQRGHYDAGLLEPARDFVVELGERLKGSYPNLEADPRLNGSIFRIHRDTRFSADKTPYKTHLGIWFWEGGRPKLESVGFYFQIDPPGLLLATGNYMFTPAQLKVYRESVVHPEYGPALVAAIETVKARGDYKLSGQHYKKVPRGYDPAHPNASLLLHNGLSMDYETVIPSELYEPGLVDYCFEKYRDMAPVHEWLVAMLERVPVAEAGN